MPPNAESGSASRARTYASSIVVAGRDAAGIGVLDHHGGRLGELERDPQRGVEVEQVRVRQFLALMHLPRAAACPAAARSMPPADADSRRNADRALRRATARPGAARRPLDRPLADASTASSSSRSCASYSRRVHERLLHQPEPELERRAAGARELLEHARIVLRDATTTSTSRKFFAAARSRLGPPMSISSTRASNGVSGFSAAFAERIQVDDDEIDRPMPCARRRREVVRAVAARQDPREDRRVQRLDAAVHHFGEAGHVGDIQ